MQKLGGKKVNILKHELRAGLKAFLLWTLGLFFLVFVGMVKFTGLHGGGASSVTTLLEQIPKPILAVLGMAGIDVTTLGGYYAVLIYYALICIAIYSVSLGINLVNREVIDKTYEFLFTKPRTRSFILSIKLVVNTLYLAIFCILNCLFSFMAVAALKFENTIGNAIGLYSLVMFILGLMFMSLGAFVAVISKKTEKGSLYGNICILLVFVLGMVYDMLENGEFLRFFSPLKYFIPKDVLNGKLDLLYVAVCLGVTVVLFIKTYVTFEKKDFIA